MTEQTPREELEFLLNISFTDAKWQTFKAFCLRHPATGVGSTSDGYHTFDELYRYRMLYNAALFNEWDRARLYDVHKSKRHSSGELCFGGEYFIVVAQLPTGQISNHYKLEHWSLFRVPNRLQARTYDGHTPEEAANRLEEFLSRQEEYKVAREIAYYEDRIEEISEHLSDLKIKRDKLIREQLRLENERSM